MTIVTRGRHRSAALWESTRHWVVANPGKTAAIITPAGTYRLSYEPRDTSDVDAVVTDAAPPLEQFEDMFRDFFALNPAFAEHIGHIDRNLSQLRDKLTEATQILA